MSTVMDRRAFVGAAAAMAGGVVASSVMERIALADEALEASDIEMFRLPMGAATADEIVAKANVRELVEYERYCRDYKHYKEMQDLYSEDSEVVVSWMRGTGKEFVAQTAARFGKSTAKGGHKIFNTVVWLNGDKAVAESMCVIIARGMIDGIESDAPAYSRMLFRVQKEGEAWKIKSFDSVYEFDSIYSAFPSDRAPLDAEELANYRESYKGISYIQAAQGREPDYTLPGDDDAESIRAMYQKVSDWLLA